MCCSSVYGSWNMLLSRTAKQTQVTSFVQVSIGGEYQPGLVIVAPTLCSSGEQVHRGYCVTYIPNLSVVILHTVCSKTSAGMV